MICVLKHGSVYRERGRWKRGVVVEKSREVEQTNEKGEKTKVVERYTEEDLTKLRVSCPLCGHLGTVVAPSKVPNNEAAAAMGPRFEAKIGQYRCGSTNCYDGEVVLEGYYGDPPYTKGRVMDQTARPQPAQIVGAGGV